MISSMKKILFGIFAHPDDEAFGPSGTLYMEAQAGTEVHLVTLTAGDAGMNPDNVDDLTATRLAEWRAAGALIGATSLHYLGYHDGTLGNKDHLEITEKIITLVQEIIDERTGVTIEFMSMDLNGVTGHIDHIVAARSACLAFYRLKAHGLPMSRIRLACQVGGAMNTDFVFMETGRTPQEISETIDARAHVQQVYDIMRAHYSQRGDGETHIKAHGENVAVNHFITLE